MEEDEFLQKIVADIKKNPDSHPPFTMENERLHHKGRLVISANSSWIPKLLAEFHLEYIEHIEGWLSLYIGWGLKNR